MLNNDMFIFHLNKSGGLRQLHAYDRKVRRTEISSNIFQGSLCFFKNNYDSIICNDNRRIMTLLNR